MQKRQRMPRKDRLREAIEEIGGEPLDGSGFENETPEEGFTGAVLLDSTFLPCSSKASHSDQ